MEPRSINRWQHRLKREHPTCTERTKALIEECGWKGGDSGDSAGKKQRDQQIPKRIPLTPTGLLMEGDYTRNQQQDITAEEMVRYLQTSSGRQARSHDLGWRYHVTVAFRSYLDGRHLR